jgi:hypothetical protein
MELGSQTAKKPAKKLAFICNTSKYKIMRLVQAVQVQVLPQKSQHDDFWLCWQWYRLLLLVRVIRVHLS